MSQHTQALTEFLAGLEYEQIPDAVLARTEDLFLDWLASALASAGSHPIPLFERYAQQMGPAEGPARIFVNGKSSSAYFAALVNGASSHLVEQDDLHNSSVLHPATVVFPAALAAAQDLGKSGRDLLVASVAGMSKDANPAALSDRLGSRWALVETSFKFHASCRHTHPAADALLDLMQREQLQADDITSVITRVHQGAIDVLGRVVVPQTVHQAKFSMGTVLGLIALYGKAGLTEFHTHALTDPRVGAFREKVSMMLDAQVDDAYPARWLGRVEVNTRDGRNLHGAIDEPKGDPGNTLSREELEDKFRRLVAFSGARSSDEAGALIDRVWRLREASQLNDLA